MKRSLFIAASFMCAAIASADPTPFTQHDFDKLAREGKSVVVDVAASWCSTCRAQKPIVNALSREPNYRNVTVLAVDFDADKPALKEFRVGMQSTLIAFKGGREIGRSIGDTSRAGIESIFKEAAQ